MVVGEGDCLEKLTGSKRSDGKILFDEKTQMGGTENCWLGREAAAMGPES